MKLDCIHTGKDINIKHIKKLLDEENIEGLTKYLNKKAYSRNIIPEIKAGLYNRYRIILNDRLTEISEKTKY
jgi:hypothetical protein